MLEIQMADGGNTKYWTHTNSNNIVPFNSSVIVSQICQHFHKFFDIIALQKAMDKL